MPFEQFSCANGIPSWRQQLYLRDGKISGQVSTFSRILQPSRYFVRMVLDDLFVSIVAKVIGQFMKRTTLSCKKERDFHRSSAILFSSLYVRVCQHPAVCSWNSTGKWQPYLGLRESRPPWLHLNLERPWSCISCSHLSSDNPCSIMSP